MNNILIVGAGPVGLAMATGLVEKGISVTIIEAASELATMPKASTIHPPTLEIFEEWGVIDDVQDSALLVEKFQYWDRATSEIIAEFELSVLEGETTYPYRFQCEQHELTNIFYEKLVKTGKADFHFNSKLVDIKQDSSSVTAYIETPEGIEEQSYNFLIGADGASSVVRKKMNIAFEGITYPQNHLLICVKNHDFTVHYPELSPVSYFFDSREWVALIQNPSLWKFLIPIKPEDEENIDDAFVQEKLRDFTKTNDVFDIYQWVIYKVHQRVAERFLDGRVAIIGDAAHVNSPLGGMGMNSGIHDAYFLANDLSEILKNKASIKSLDEYEKKRQNITKEIVQKHTIKNEENVSQSENIIEQRRSLKEIVSNKELAKAYMMRTSMIDGFNLMKS